MGTASLGRSPQHRQVLSTGLEPHLVHLKVPGGGEKPLQTKCSSTPGRWLAGGATSCVNVFTPTV